MRGLTDVRNKQRPEAGDTFAAWMTYAAVEYTVIPAF
jgi:hypothetical protein